MITIPALVAAAGLAFAPAAPIIDLDPSPTPTPSSSADDNDRGNVRQPVVKIPGTKIDVCLVAEVGDLADLGASVRALLDRSGLTFDQLKDRCLVRDRDRDRPRRHRDHSTHTVTKTAEPDDDDSSSATPAPSSDEPKGAPETGYGPDVAA